MKHLVRWLICLAFLLNTALFITLVVLGLAGTPLLLALAILCYPLSLLLVRLAKNHINSKCTFYRKDDNIWWKLAKTIFMPIVASGALIMFHLITTTFRLMNDDVEDKTGFSLASILRTAKALPLFFATGIIVYFINDALFHGSYAADDALVALLILGGAIWLANHILWDVLDFAHKESDTFIRIKNIVFLAIGVVCALWGLIIFFTGMPKEKTHDALFGHFGLMIAPLAIHMFYYGVARSGRVPQSKMTYFWGPIAMAASYLLILLGSLAGTVTIALVAIIYIVFVLASGAAIFFLGMPFFYSDGEYRLVYREFAREKRVAQAKAAGASASGGNFVPNSNASPDDIAVHRAVRDVFKIVPSSIHISAIASIDHIKLELTEANANNVSYLLRYRLCVDMRGRDSDVLFGIERDGTNKLQDLMQKVIRETERRLTNSKFDSSGIKITVEPKAET